MWRPATAYHLAHALYEPAALPTPPELRDHPDRRPSLGTGIAVGRAMRASCYSDRGPDHDRRRVTPRSSFPVSLAVFMSTPTSAPARCACAHVCVPACACARARLLRPRLRLRLRLRPRPRARLRPHSEGEAGRKSVNRIASHARVRKKDRDGGTGAKDALGATREHFISSTAYQLPPFYDRSRASR